MAVSKSKNGWSRKLFFGLVVALATWGILYTVAYARQEAQVAKLRSDVQSLEGKVSAFSGQIEEVTRRHDTLLTYVITLREQLAKSGFKALPPMPPIEKELDEDETQQRRSEEDPL